MPNPSAPSRRTLILLLGALAALGPFSIDTYLPAFPSLARDFSVTTGQVGLSLASYFLGICLGQLAYGPLLDRYGHRRPLAWGLVVYAAASLLCALAPGSLALVALRFAQALGGCAGMVAGRALVRDLFPTETARIFSAQMLVMGVAPVVAPLVGGWIDHQFGWRAIFLFLALVSTAILALQMRLLPTSPGDPGRSLSLRSILRAYVHILRQPVFVTWGLGGSLLSAGLFGYLAGSPTVFMDVLGLDSEGYSWAFAANAAALVAGSQINRHWTERLSLARLTAGVAGLQALCGILMLVCAHRWIEGLYPLVFLFLLLQGFVLPNTAALAMAPFGREAGSASALLGAVQMGIGALISLLVSAPKTPSALPMGLGLLACSGGGLTWVLLRRR